MTQTSKRRGWAVKSSVLLVALLFCVVGAIIADRLYPPDLSAAERYSPTVLARNNELLRAFVSRDQKWRLPLTLDQVDPLFVEMLLHYEDQRFYHHPGVDALALARALLQWLRHRRIVSGASTLTMQVARLLYKYPHTVRGKVLQIVRALQLEWHFDKQRILALYLALAPYGGNLEGLRAASWAYFGKEPRHLSAAEAALLVVMPQSPNRLRPERFPEQARDARDKVLRRMRRVGVLSEQRSREALADALPARRHALPFVAPHLARRLMRAYRAQNSIETTIDISLQHSLEALANTLPLTRSASAAILVVENKTLDVRAYIGSKDFFDPFSAGQVDMVRAVRSPGSALKPFVYGLAFDDLIVHPDTLIEDVPTRFGNYAPSNFQNRYLGQISVREALQRSQNIPAVAILQRLGPARFAAKLKQAGVRLHWPGGYTAAGLPMALGGVGISLQALVEMYCAIANRGALSPIRFLRHSENPGTRPLLSPAAAWYLRDILLGAPPPANAITDANRSRPRAIAFKTGTSYGFRDAWAIGFSDHFTVGVWLGRPDGAPHPGHYGRNSAAPILFRVFDLLPAALSGAKKTIAPDAVISAAELPEMLREFSPNRQRRTIAAPLKITFPVDGSTVELGPGMPLPLTAQGGARPLVWLVNGQPLHGSRLRRDMFWQPDGVGAARITVMDRSGASSGATVWLAYRP